jgi:RNA polymerase sigma factor (sigma-70 family)
MNEWVGRWPDGLVSAESALDREFEDRLRDSSGLAFSIAYGVLRNRADAEEVAQDAFARAFRRFRQLRDRDRFRSWLTRMTWRLAIDRWRSDRRRMAREYAVIAQRTLKTSRSRASVQSRSGSPSTGFRRSCVSSSSWRRWRDTTREKWPPCSTFPKAP